VARDFYSLFAPRCLPPFAILMFINNYRLSSTQLIKLDLNFLKLLEKLLQLHFAEVNLMAR
jgi:hypothetical protein